jgi:hypothetical protein
LGEFKGVYAVLRREFNRGNLKWFFFEDLFGVPRRCTEEGGQLVLPQVCLGEVFGGLGVGAPL